MTKADIVADIAEETGLERLEALKAVEAFMTSIKSTPRAEAYGVNSLTNEILTNRNAFSISFENSAASGDETRVTSGPILR